jgi:hypothetical protein
MSTQPKNELIPNISLSAPLAQLLESMPGVFHDSDVLEDQPMSTTTTSAIIVGGTRHGQEVRQNFGQRWHFLAPKQLAGRYRKNSGKGV